MSRYLTARRTGLSLLVTFTLAAVGCLAEQGPDDESETGASDESGLSSAQCASAASWATDKAYAVGAIVKYQSKVYTCLQAHTSQAGWTPAAVPALWHEEACAGGSTTATSSAASSSASSTSASSTSASTGGGSCGSTPWHQGTSYVTGDIVTYNGSLYIATHDNPGYDPTISTWFWSPYAGCSSSTSSGAGGAGGGSSTSSSSTTGSGGSGGAGGGGAVTPEASSSSAITRRGLTAGRPTARIPYWPSSRLTSTSSTSPSLSPT